MPRVTTISPAARSLVPAVDEYIAARVAAARRNFPAPTYFTKLEAHDMADVEALLDAAGVRWDRGQHLGNWSYRITGEGSDGATT